MKKIYFVRHGETEGNRENLFRGRADFPLNENGRKQAYALREVLSDVTFDKVFSSPLSRASETAQIVAPKNKILIDELLQNMDVGEWAGHKKDEIKEKYPAKWKEWAYKPEKMVFPGGESIEELYKRCNSFIEKLKDVEGENILVVSHRSVMKALFAAILGLKDNYFWKFYFDNASFSLVGYNNKRGYTILRLNDASHIDKSVVEKF